MEVTELWKSHFAVGSFCASPLLLAGFLAEPLGPLCFTPDPKTLTLLFSSPSLCTPLSPPHRFSLSRFLGVSSSSSALPASVSTSIANSFGPQHPSPSSDLCHNRLHLLRRPGTLQVLAFFPTGENSDQLGYVLLSLRNPDSENRGELFVVSKKLNQRIIKIVVHPVGEESGKWSYFCRAAWQKPITMLWLASLCKILHASSSTSKVTFLNNGEAVKKTNILLVFAHPDDESMFFSPTTNYISSRGHNLHILCMSTGNADGMGDTRKEELYKACLVLKVPLQQVKVLDHPALQDGFGKVWDHVLLAKLIEEEVVAHGINLIISFDSYGVSGLCNHRDVHHGIRKFLLDHGRQNIEAWELVSTNILRKYSGAVDIWFSIAYCANFSKSQLHCLLNVYPRKSFLAMSQHRSQWVWFRKLFVTLSSYTYVNTLWKIAN